MIQLLLETATDACSVAVARDGLILAEHTAGEVHQHASHLTIFIRDVMASAGVTMDELDEVVLSDGPGSFTSLRVGAATAKGLCMALPGLKLRVVPTLLSLAMAAPPHDEMTLAVINSRRGEVYGQLFDFRGAHAQVQGALEKQGTRHLRPLLLAPQNIRLTDVNWLQDIEVAAKSAYFQVCGPGRQRIWDALGDANAGQNVGFAKPEHCSAVHLLAPAHLAGSVTTSSPETSRLADVATYEPFYLNPPFVTVSKKKPLG